MLASIDWGDGTTSIGAITLAGGVFTVAGTHTYVNAGSFSVSVTVESNDGSYATVGGTATITGSVTAQTVAVTGQAGTALSGVAVATFTASTGSPFTAAIDWGDGNISAGTVTLAGGVYTVAGTNTYGSAGQFPVTVEIIDNSSTVVAMVSNPASISGPALSVVGLRINAATGTAFTGTVARFSSGNAASVFSDFRATIDWGDNTPEGFEDAGARAGTTVAEPGGTVAVTGSHTYLQAGRYPVAVTIVDGSGAFAVAIGTAVITDQLSEVTAVAPNSGPPSGGTAITIQGTGLVGATAVTFGSIAATGFMVNDDGSITAIAPAQAAGTVDITVTTPGGTSGTSGADQFAYLASAPSVMGLSPASGPTGGGTSVTITGTNLAPATEVLFGSISADGFIAISATSITAIAPAQLAGTVDVSVITPYGTSTTSSSDQFTYNGTTPTVTAIDPVTGPTGGGRTVTVLGTNYNGATAVTFGTTAATDFSVGRSDTIFATAPALTAGTYDITVTTPYGTSATSAADQYTAVALAAVTGVSPTSGPTGGGTSVAVSGSGFANAVQVYFGASPATTFTVNSSTRITATAPPQTAGTVDVTVVRVEGTSATSAADQFTYNPTAPSVTGLNTTCGPLAGGTVVAITGANFNGATAVNFGATAATSFTVLSATQIVATAPAGTAGTVDITVTSPYGTSGTSAADQFTYVDQAPPVVTGLNATSGAMAGGGSVIITGSKFTGATAVYFGATAATTYTVNSDTQITVTVPTARAGTVDVTVATPYGISLRSTFDQYTFLAAVPSVTGMSPSTGTTAGGDSVTISGSNFTNATAVYFGGLPAASFGVVSDSSIVAISPVQAAGTVDVTVGNPSGLSPVVSADQFTCTAATGIATVTGVSPSSGPIGGGTSVTITGTGFTGATVVYFGNLLATLYAVVSDTSITAQAPPQAAGTVDIQVSTPNGISAAVTADQFTYVTAAPTVTAVAPGSGPAAGGSEVVITGTNFIGATAVTFGTTAATVYAVDSATQITATAPALAAGTYDITVTTSAGTSSTSPADEFTAVTPAPPVVTTIDTPSGPMSGGTVVVLTGTNFTGATAVAFGDVPATTFTVDSATQITVHSPPQVSATVDITVTTPSGTSGTSPNDQFTYWALLPLITSISPNYGPTSGGTAVTISGINLTGVVGVTFGTTPALTFQGVSDNTIVAVSPLAGAGTVDVTVTTVNGTSLTSSSDDFTYTTTASSPTVTGVSPGSGPASGGTSVTITGTNLTGALAVYFGAVAAEFTVVSSTQITATAPFQVAGTVDVVVMTYSGISATSSADQYTYTNVAPTVTGVSPNTALTSGGTVVTLTGTGFTGAIYVSFGTVTTYQLTISSDTTMSLFVPINAPGAVDVTVTTPSGTSATSSADVLTYSAATGAPTVTGISPGSGPTGGGTSVTVTGTAFDDVTAVSFGGTPAASFTVVSGTSITAASPFASAGTVDVTVSTSLGISPSTSADQFTYNGTAPTVTAISPNSGPLAGGTVVTITGTNLNGATIVTFGLAVASFTVDSATQITATAPAAAALSTVDIRVTTPYGTSGTSSADQYTYIVNPPTILNISPPTMQDDGSTLLTVTGTGFAGLVAFAFGGTPVDEINVVSPTQAYVRVRHCVVGVFDLTVTTGDGTSLTSDITIVRCVSPECQTGSSSSTSLTSCCPNPLPGTLYATFTNGTGTCSCLNGYTITITGPSPGTEWVGTGGPICSVSQVVLSLFCLYEVDVGRVWVLSAGTFCGLRAILPASNAICSPFYIKFSGVAVSDCCSGSVDVTITQ
jgi:hypothetical protein